MLVDVQIPNLLPMNVIMILAVHGLRSLVILLGSGGSKALLAENLLLKQQLLVLNRARRRAPRISLLHRLLLVSGASFSIHVVSFVLLSSFVPRACSGSTRPGASVINCCSLGRKSFVLCDLWLVFAMRSSTFYCRSEKSQLFKSRMHQSWRGRRDEDCPCRLLQDTGWQTPKIPL